MSAYLVGNITFLITWLGVYLAYPKMRKLQFFGSFLLLPFGILDIWFRPDYWNPPTLIKTIEPLSIETFLYCFCAGGIAMAVGAIISKKQYDARVNWSKIISFFIFAFGLYAIFQITKLSSAMNNLNFSFLTIWLFLMPINPKKNIMSVIPALVFAVFTVIAINIGFLFYPGFVKEYWHLEKLWPTFANTPTEEIFFAGILAALWTLLPKYLLNKNHPRLKAVGR